MYIYEQQRVHERVRTVEVIVVVTEPVGPPVGTSDGFIPNVGGPDGEPDGTPDGIMPNIRSSNQQRPQPEIRMHKIFPEKEREKKRIATPTRVT